MAQQLTEEDKKQVQKERKALIRVLLPQLVLSTVVTASVLYGGYYHCHSLPVPTSNDMGDKLTFYIRCCVFPCAVLLFLAIQSVANKRGSTPAVNPLAGKEHFVVLEKNFLSNTIEQMLVFLMITLTLTSYLDASEMRILPVYALLWVVGRILFRIGYGISPRYRSFGMLISFEAAVVFLTVIFYLMYTRGFLPGSGVGTGNSLPTKSEL